jgi:16S rRNA (guanine527-N7)-methyltransferase
MSPARPPVWHGRLASALADAGLAGSLTAVERLAAYVQELARWSGRMSLTTLEPAGIVERLVKPSLAIATLAPYRSAGAVADLGSGGGIPGIPLQVAAPRRRFVLIEARQRRAVFLRHAVRALGLAGVEVVEGRAEALAWQGEERVDLVVSRAVAPIATLLPWCAGLLRPGGAVVVAVGDMAAVAGGLPAGWEEGERVATPGGVIRSFVDCST